MDYISRLELRTIVLHTYNNNTLSLSNDELAMILHTNHPPFNEEFNTHDEIRRTLADALVFIHTLCKQSKHEDLLSMHFKTWNDFFDTCFVDIICNGADRQLCKSAGQLQRRVNQYSAYYGTYTPLTLNIVNTKDLFKQLAITAFIGLLLPL